MRLLLVGRYPPPYGGVTVHIQRLAEAAIRHGIDCSVLDLYAPVTPDQADTPDYVTTIREKGFLRYPALMRAIRRLESMDIVHLHASDMEKLATAGPILLRNLPAGKRVLTIHHGGFDANYLRKSAIVKRLIRQTVGGMDAVIFPTAHLEKRVQNVLGDSIRRSIVASAFISFKELNFSDSFPPFDNFKARVNAGDPEPTAILLTSVYGFPYYGQNLVVDAVRRLRDEGERVAVVLSFYASGDTEYESKVVQQLQELAPLLVVRDLKPKDFLYLLAKCDVYARPTTVDNCGVTVHEALALGTPCVASDVCERPDGAILHKNGDANSLAVGLVQAIKRRHNTDDLEALARGGEDAHFALYDSLLRAK